MDGEYISRRMVRLPGQEASRKTKKGIYGCEHEGGEDAEEAGTAERSGQKKNRTFLKV